MSNEIEFEVVKQHLFEVKEKLGADAAKRVIHEAGQTSRMSEIHPNHYQAAIDECKRVLALPIPEGATMENAPPQHFHAVSTAMQDAAIKALNEMPSDANVALGLNTVYTAWVNGNFIVPTET